MSRDSYKEGKISSWIYWCMLLLLQTTLFRFGAAQVLDQEKNGPFTSLYWGVLITTSVIALFSNPLTSASLWDGLIEEDFVTPIFDSRIGAPLLLTLVVGSIWAGVSAWAASSIAISLEIIPYTLFFAALCVSKIWDDISELNFST